MDMTLILIVLFVIVVLRLKVNIFNNCNNIYLNR